MAEFILTFMQFVIHLVALGILLGVAVVAATYIASYITAFLADGTRGVKELHAEIVNDLTPEHPLPLNRR